MLIELVKMAHAKMLVYVFTLLLCSYYLCADTSKADEPAHIDLLKPKQDGIFEWHFAELLKKLAAGVEYKITEKYIPGGKAFGAYYPPRTECNIILPDNIQKEIDQLKIDAKSITSYYMIMPLSWKYIQKNKYSYYVPILDMGFDWGIMEKECIIPIIEKNKDKWDKNITEYISKYPKGSSYDYSRALSSAVIPRPYKKELFGDNEYDKNYNCGYVLDDFIKNKWQISDTQEFRDIKQALLYVRYQQLSFSLSATSPSSFPATTSSAPASIPSSQLVEPFPEVVKLVNKVPYNKNALWAWSLFLINTTDKQVMDFLPYFMEYCRFQNPRPPLLTAFCMSLIIVRGYDYDWDTGKYLLNDMGKALLDYVVENPIPEAIWQTTVLNANGCEETITAAVKKYHKLQNWNEFLDKNPKFKEFSTKPVQPWLEQPASNPSPK